MKFCVNVTFIRVRGSPMYRVLDSGSEGPGFDTRCQIRNPTKYTGTDVLVKSVESKVPTVRAYVVAEVNRRVPAQVSTSSLDRGSKLRGVIGCVKALDRG